MHEKKHSGPYYEIRVEGELGEVWLEWFEGLRIRHESDPKNGNPISVLFGEIPDSAALHGVLNKVRDLNLNLISAIRIERSNEREER